MKAVLFQEGRVAVVDKPLPPAGGGEALIRTAVAGICSTDRELLAGYHDFAGIPGDEFVGTVVRAPARPELVGRRVEVWRQLHLRSRDRVVVLGGGTVGILIALSLRLACPRLLLCGRYPGKLGVVEA